MSEAAFQEAKMRIRNAGIFLLALATLVMAGCSTGLTAEEVRDLVQRACELAYA